MSTTVEMRLDVFWELFKGKGRASRRKGWWEFDYPDFARCELPPSWNIYIDHLGDGRKINFPVGQTIFTRFYTFLHFYTQYSYGLETRQTSKRL